MSNLEMVVQCRECGKKHAIPLDTLAMLVGSELAGFDCDHSPLPMPTFTSPRRAANLDPPQSGG